MSAVPVRWTAQHRPHAGLNLSAGSKLPPCHVVPADTRAKAPKDDETVEYGFGQSCKPVPDGDFVHDSIFDILEKEDLNRLTIGHDWRTGTCHVSSGKTWDHGTVWANYNKTFSTSTPLTSDAVCHGAASTRALFRKHGALDYLEGVIELLRKGKHHCIDCFFDTKNNIRFMNNVHSDVLGVNNRSHALRAGGIRRHGLDEEEYEVIIDGLNLSRGMSFKNFAARIPYGGCKMTVMMEPVRLDDMGALGFLAYALDMSRAFTGPDMGFPTELADVLKEHFTLNITGGPGGPLGATGTPTAFGTYRAVGQAVRFVKGSPSLRGVKIAVQGLGAVGVPLCEHYIREGAALVVTDIDPGIVDRFCSTHQDADIEVVPPEDILFVEADVFSPCATGGILTMDLIPRLRFKIIMGAANNQLKASSREEECSLARALQRHGILFQVAWWHNLGGVLCGREEYEMQHEASMDNVLARVEQICTEHTWSNLTESHQLSMTPTEHAYASAENVIYQA